MKEKYLEHLSDLSFLDFEGVGIRLASPEVIVSWSRGEVTKAETINYRTQKSEKDGLFCEKIFGPVKDFECNCGKYKKIKYKGTVCDRCGVEVISSSVRRERMGHIDLAVPVAHVFFYKIPPSKTGLLLDLTINQLEAVLNYEAYVVGEQGNSPYRRGTLLADEEYIEAVKTHDGFAADMGGSSILDLLKGLDLDNLSSDLRMRLEKETLPARRLTLLKKLKIVEAFRLSGNKPEWMVLTRLPVIPPDLRPLVSLEGGRYATSDLNDLYKRVITRNNRLKGLLAIKTPEVILRNEKRMLQDAVDALFDNSRRNRPIKGRGNRPLKSLADALKGKQGRFRRNLLGKRVDYSGRSVIVVGPELKLHQCGLPKEMALELFRPLVMRRLEEKGIAESERKAKRLMRIRSTEVYEILEEITRHHPVLLNRAPTLHRVSIQAFEPVLIEGRAIAIHPMVCVPYNADFDGDTMSVHVPISPESVLEAYLLMLSVVNIRSPAHGKPLMSPTQDSVIGIHYLTKVRPGADKTRVKHFGSYEEVMMALDERVVGLHDEIKYLTPARNKHAPPQVVITTPGRVIFNKIMPSGIPYVNETLNKKKLVDLVDRCLRILGSRSTAVLLDELKVAGFEYATLSGLTIGIDDMIIPPQKETIWKQTEKEVARINAAFKDGLLSESERYNKVVDAWTRASIEIEEALIDALAKDQDGFNPIHMMVVSGARGSRQQACQISGLRGLMSKPQRKIVGLEVIETPIRSSCKEGLSVLEYFISTHGSRKGLTDTALKTADAGYLTRRLVDVAQNVTITMDDCETILGQELGALKEGEKIVESLTDRIAGRVALLDVVDPRTDETLVKGGEMISDEAALKIERSGVERVKVRSVLTCEAPAGLCAKCYGRNLASGMMVEHGEAVGIVAAQSIGEPGTQLTLRTFHGGGAAARIAESTTAMAEFKGTVEFDTVSLAHRDDAPAIALHDRGKILVRKGKETQRFNLPIGATVFVKDKAEVGEGDILFEWDPYSIPIISTVKGEIEYVDVVKGITMQEDYVDERSERKQRVIIEDRTRTRHPKVKVVDGQGKTLRTYAIPAGAYLMVKDKQGIVSGDFIARIPKEIGKSKDITGGLPRVEELFEGKHVKDPAVVCEINGIADVEEIPGYWLIKATPEVGESRQYKIPSSKYVKVHPGERVKAGEPLCEGSVDAQDILRIKGPMAVQEFLVNEIQEVYRIQDVKIDDKHIEVIVRQMLQKVKIDEPGNTPFVGGEIVDKKRVLEVNERVIKESKRPATYHPILLGVTRASLSSESFFSAASFQETTKVLSEAAIEGKIDYLEGLKENVIVGRLIPAGSGLAIYQNIEVEDTIEETATETAL